jgi:hypothetical protein
MNEPLFYVVTFERSGAVRYLVEFRDNSRPIVKPTRDEAQAHDLATATAFCARLKEMNLRAALEPA